MVQFCMKYAIFNIDMQNPKYESDFFFENELKTILNVFLLDGVVVSITTLNSAVSNILFHFHSSIWSINKNMQQ
jgi:hypothetical protein